MLILRPGGPAILKMMVSMQEINDPAMNRPVDRCDYLLLLFLLPLYFFICGRFGQKFAAAVVVSLATGAGLRLIMLVLQPSGESARPQASFGWQLFFLFPLFYPLAMPLWLVPGILIVAYLIAVSSFGGYGRQIFTPLAVAVVFMLAGYSHTASLHPVRPLPGAFDGFKIWSAGLPPSKAVWQIYAEVMPSSLLSASYSGSLPSLPGLAFGLPLLLASAALSLLAGRRWVWWLTSLLAIQIFTMLGSGHSGLEISALHPLLLGAIPGLLLVAVADCFALPEDNAGQVVGGILFAGFAMLFVFRSPNLLGPVYGLLLAQIVGPLLTDLIMRRGNPT